MDDLAWWISPSSSSTCVCDDSNRVGVVEGERRENIYFYCTFVGSELLFVPQCHISRRNNKHSVKKCFMYATLRKVHVNSVHPFGHNSFCKNWRLIFVHTRPSMKAQTIFFGIPAREISSIYTWKKSEISTRCHLSCLLAECERKKLIKLILNILPSIHHNPRRVARSRTKSQKFVKKIEKFHGTFLYIFLPFYLCWSKTHERLTAEL